MGNDMAKEKRKYTTKDIIVIVVVSMVIISLLGVSIYNTMSSRNGTIEEGVLTRKDLVDKGEVSITKEDIEKYKEIIGDNMSAKRSIVVLMRTIEDWEKAMELGNNIDEIKKLGIVPEMQNDGEVEYYNAELNSKFDIAYDSLDDGEVYQEPIEFAGMYTYLKRIGPKELTDDDVKSVVELNKDVFDGLK